MAQDSSDDSKKIVFSGNGDSASKFLLRLKLHFMLDTKLDSDKKKILFAATCFQSGAFVWFERWLGVAKIEDVTSNLTEFFKDFLKEFTNPFDETAARISLHDMKFVPSSSMNVATFASTVFNPVALRLDDSEKTLAFAFASKLPPAMRSSVMQSVPKTLAEAVTAACIYETSFAQHQSPQAPVAHLNASVAQAEPPTWEMFAQLAASYAGSNSPARRSWRPPASKSSFLPKLSEADRTRCLTQGLCFKCRLSGHVAKNCPATSSTLKF